MSPSTKNYSGPEMAAWRKAALKHANHAMAGLLALTGLALFAKFMLRWQLPAGLPSMFVVLVVSSLLVRFWVRYERMRLVREAALPQFLKRKLREIYPHLVQKDAELVERGLRQFFLACLRSHGKFVAMPSRVVDTMWHEFILHTRAYGDWCNLALGRFVHHAPAEVLGKSAVHSSTNNGLRRAWYWACKDEAINPKAPNRLPLLFALDGKLGIANGFAYVPNCRGLKTAGDQGGIYVHCGESFSDGSYSGDAGTFGGSDVGSDSGGGVSGSSDGDAGGGGDGGGGCGGGD